MTNREQRQYDQQHDIEDDGPECPVNGIPAQFCPKGCSHNPAIEEAKAAAEERSVSGEAA